PSQMYQLCEVLMPGWKNNLPAIWSVFNPTGDNSTTCTNIGAGTGLPLVPGMNIFRIDNTRPPGGLSRTIGFWKNWSSCTGGGQAFLLDANLPVVVDDYLTLTTCQEGFAILNKSDMKSGKKMSSDPLYNMAAQY